MADLNFPSAPNTNDLYTFNGITYRYDGSRWRYANASVVTITGGNAVTTFNSLQSSNQDFAVGYSGSTLNISSSGNTHTFNIPLAGNATTGLVSGNAQTIYGVKTFNSALIASDSTNSTSTTTGAVTVTGGVGIGGSLYVASATAISGIIINAGVITGSLTGTASTATYSHQSGYAITSGTATTATNINIVSATTSASHPVLFTPTSGSASGVAVSSNSTLVYNPFTDILSVSGLAVTVGTASTSPTTGALIISGGVGIAETVNIGANLGISGLTTLTYTSEKLNTKTSAGSAGTVTHDLSTGSIFYHSSISSNFTANITNVPTTNDRAIGVTLVLAQGVTAYMSTALQIDGSAQTIKWVNNSTPAGTASKVDIVGFSLIRTGSAWTVLGQYSTYG